MPENETTQPREKILTEVLLEIRFNGAPDVSLLVGKMHEALQATYPTFENLNIPDFPVNFPNADSIVKYRIFNEDRTKLYNLGKGVLSINTVNYSNFENFLQDAKVVLEKYKEISAIGSLSRIGLRYINKIALQDRSFEQLFRMNFDIPDSLKSVETGFAYQTFGKINNDLLSTRFFTPEPFSKETLILDFDYYNEQQMNFDIATVETWARNAQSTILTNFKNILTETYYQTLTQ